MGLLGGTVRGTDRDLRGVFRAGIGGGLLDDRESQLCGPGGGGGKSGPDGGSIWGGNGLFGRSLAHLMGDCFEVGIRGRCDD